LLFFADERTKAAFTDRRASVRKLHSAVCSFREAGSVEPSFGVTYNVSSEGLYIRTLDPPAAGTTIWVELHAPSTTVPVHLRAAAVWQKLPGGGKGVVPPGFGLRLDYRTCPPDDLGEFLKGYAALLG